jgi:hypothetical protein
MAVWGYHCTVEERIVPARLLLDTEMDALWRSATFEAVRLRCERAIEGIL